VTYLPSPSATPFPEGLHVISGGPYSNFGLVWMNSSNLIPITVRGTGLFTVFEIDDIPGRLINLETAIVEKVSVSSEIVYNNPNELNFTIESWNLTLPER
jgi:hypothetical protein